MPLPLSPLPLVVPSARWSFCFFLILYSWGNEFTSFFHPWPAEKLQQQPNWFDRTWKISSWLSCRCRSPVKIGAEKSHLLNCRHVIRWRGFEYRDMKMWWVKELDSSLERLVFEFHWPTKAFVYDITTIRDTNEKNGPYYLHVQLELVSTPPHPSVPRLLFLCQSCIFSSFSRFAGNTAATKIIKDRNFMLYLPGTAYNQQTEKRVSIDLNEPEPPMIQTSKTRKQHSKYLRYTTTSLIHCL